MILIPIISVNIIIIIVVVKNLESIVVLADKRGGPLPKTTFSKGTLFLHQTKLSNQLLPFMHTHDQTYGTSAHPQHTLQKCVKRRVFSQLTFQSSMKCKDVPTLLLSYGTPCMNNWKPGIFEDHDNVILSFCTL